MSSIRRPESATASFTAVNACAASGMSAIRETLENPTPLTAILHRLSHMRCLPLSPCEPELRQRDVVVQFLKENLNAAANLRLGILRLQQVAGEQRARRLVELHDDAGVRHGGREALVASVIHDGVGIDRAGPAHGFEFQVGADALDAG